MPADPTPAPARGPVPPSWILEFFGSHNDPMTPEDWVESANSYYEVPYRDVVASLRAFAQSVRDAAFRDAAGKCGERERVLRTEAREQEKSPARWSDSDLSDECATEAGECADAILALVGTAPKPTESAPVSEANEEADRG